MEAEEYGLSMVEYRRLIEDATVTAKDISKVLKTPEKIYRFRRLGHDENGVWKESPHWEDDVNGIEEGGLGCRNVGETCLYHGISQDIGKNADGSYGDKTFVICFIFFDVFYAQLLFILLLAYAHDPGDDGERQNTHAASQPIERRGADLRGGDLLEDHLGAPDKSGSYEH